VYTASKADPRLGVARSTLERTTSLRPGPNSGGLGGELGERGAESVWIFCSDGMCASVEVILTHNEKRGREGTREESGEKAQRMDGRATTRCEAAVDGEAPGGAAAVDRVMTTGSGAGKTRYDTKPEKRETRGGVVHDSEGQARVTQRRRGSAPGHRTLRSQLMGCKIASMTLYTCKSVTE
jgi:hypothetical protein